MRIRTASPIGRPTITVYWLLGLTSCTPHTTAEFAPAERTDFYVISHMANTQEAVDWSIEQGANGIEIDLRFADNGDPISFHHGAVCDCRCGTGDICRRFGSTLCDSEVGAAELLAHIAKSQAVALVIIDSKLETTTPKQEAGRLVVALLADGLFAKGYRGNVILSTASFKDFTYLQAAASAAAESEYSPRMFFAFDQEGSKVADNIERLIALPTASRAFGTGISACLPGRFRSAVRLAERNRKAGVIGFTYIWTLDKRSSFETYYRLGIRSIVTNSPGSLVQFLTKSDVQLAKPGARLPTASSNNIAID